MQVVKRSGEREAVDFDKITQRLRNLASIRPRIEGVDIPRVAQAVVAGVADGISTRELDILSAETAAGFVSEEPDYDFLAARIIVSDLHKRTTPSFVDTVRDLHANACTTPSGSKQSAPLVTDELLHFAEKYQEKIDAETDHERDFRAYDYFAIRTLLNGYLLVRDGVPAERPSHLLWRVAVSIHRDDWDRVLETYRAMAAGEMTHATPSLYYAGTPRSQYSSCYLLQINDDTIESIYEAVKNCAIISKSGGGIGLAVSKVRANGALVRSTGREANGVLPALRVLNECARHVSQGGRRKGAIAVYVETHHPDLLDIVNIRLNHGVESNRARDLFPAIWVSDLFMKRVEADESWSFFSPDTAPGLDEVWGKEYEDLYLTYENEGKAFKVARARELWRAITTAQVETGTPYTLFKDTVNQCNAQANVGIIRCSNLCSEITLHVDSDESAVCNLASIALPRFVDEDTYSFDFGRLESVVKMTVRNLDTVIDITFNPTPEAARSNERNRPIGVGVQGLADAFMALRMPFDSEAARALNVDIFDTTYRAALDASADLAAEKGAYPTFSGSPASRGSLQPDLFLEGRYGTEQTRARLRERLDTDAWRAVRRKIAEHGLRQSTLVALMPTASTAQILGNTEAFEPLGSNMYVRRTLSGEFTIVNRRLIRDLQGIGRWDAETRYAILRDEGSVQGIVGVPDDIKELHRSVWDIRQKHICEMAADRAPFVDQSQSLNIHMSTPTQAKLSALHFHNWRAGLKTSSYYIRSRGASSAQQFTVPLKRVVQEASEPRDATVVCEGDVCVMCSS